MERLIVHIEFDADEVPEDWIKDRIDDILSQAVEDALGWRYFDSLEEAMAWERGEGKDPADKGSNSSISDGYLP